MSDQEDRSGKVEERTSPVSLPALRLGRKPRLRRSGWEPEPLAFGGLFDSIPPEPAKAEQPQQQSRDSGVADPASLNPLRKRPPTVVSSHLPVGRTVPDSPLPAVDPETETVWTVRALITDIRNQVESGYTNVRVTGEVSNLRPAPSGHLYFTLKDGEAQLPVVLFRRQALLLRFRPKDGDDIQVRGRISLYESRGQLQLIAEQLELRGAGALQLAFQRLKARLLAEGLFAPDRKRPLPAFPRCIGIITSVAGAVIRDIVTVAGRRHAKLNLLIYPAVMQGASCPTTVAAGIRWFNANPNRVDVILIARGGGSFEDLDGFNDESLARVIAASDLPVVSAIGHETDFTIADFVADLRAATPSAAAELITSAQHQIELRLEVLTMRATRAIRFQLLASRQRFALLSSEQVLTRLRDAISRRDQRIDDLSARLSAAAALCLRNRHARLAGLEARIRRQDIRFSLANTHRRLATATTCLQRATARLLEARHIRLARAQTRLEALSPLAVLHRGYALVYSAEGVLLRSSHETQPNQQIHARLARGTLTARVLETRQP